MRSKLDAFRRSFGATFPAVAFVALFAVGFLPLFGGPGYEYSLAAGLLLPSLAALWASAELRDRHLLPFEQVLCGLERGSELVVVGLLVSLLHGLRVGFCAPIHVIGLYLLGPGVGTLLGGLAGAAAAFFGRRFQLRRWITITLAMAGPLLGIAISVVRFLTSPMVFAYDPFFGFFSGTIYDTVLELNGLLTYRLGSSALLFGVLLLSFAKGAATSKRTRRFAMVFGLGLVLASCAMHLLGSRLDHWHTRGTISAELGGRASGARCDVVFDRKLKDEDIHVLLRECDAYVAEAETFFGAAYPSRLTAFVFASSNEKRRLMGAANTQIAKPWRKEIYVEARGFPDPVLGHEVAHVVAGGFARGPFRVAGALFGVLPNPGLIEGVAVAASPSDEELGPLEWARAMKDLALLPNLESLFGLGFLGKNSALAYTVSGAFVSFVRGQYGAEAVRAWYGGASLHEVTGRTWEQLERDFLRELDAHELSAAMRLEAKRRFDRPAVFARTRPHVVDGCLDRAGDLVERDDLTRASEEIQNALELDPNNRGAVFTRVNIELRRGNGNEASALLNRIYETEALEQSTRDRALERLGDIALWMGETERARALYEQVRERAGSYDRLRGLEVKLLAAEDATARSAIVELLVPHSDPEGQKLRAAELLARWDEREATSLSAYLLARTHYNEKRYQLAAEQFERAVQKTISLPHVALEALRMRVVVAAVLGQCDRAGALLPDFVHHPLATPSLQAAAERMVARCP